MSQVIRALLVCAFAIGTAHPAPAETKKGTPTNKVKTLPPQDKNSSGATNSPPASCYDNCMTHGAKNAFTCKRRCQHPKSL